MSTETNGKSTLGLALSALSGLGLVIAGAWVIIDLKIENSVYRNTELRNTELAALQARFDAAHSENESKLIEVETQFRAMENIVNTNLAGQLRIDSMLWRKSFDSEFPQQVYFPTISKERR